MSVSIFESKKEQDECIDKAWNSVSELSDLNVMDISQF